MISLELSEFEFEELLKAFNGSYSGVDESGNPILGSFSISTRSYTLNERMEELYYQWTRYGTTILHKDSTNKILSNQGRVRSDNPATISCNGLFFRSDNEVNLYKALKSSNVSFAPLPVFIRGGVDYKRIEPDFVILKEGIVLIVEVDGGSHKETPVEAHERLTMLTYEGAFIERVKASECDTFESAKNCVERLLQIIEKLKRLH